MSEIIHYLTAGAVLILLVFVVLRHTYEPILEIVARYSDWAANQVERLRERELTRILARLANTPELQLLLQRQVNTEQRGSQGPETEGPRAVVKEIVARHARKLPGVVTAVGLIKQTWLTWYVDLRDPMTDRNTRLKLARALAAHIRQITHARLQGAPITYTKLAVPEPGNQVLGMAVAEDLGVPWVAVKSTYRRINQHDTFDGIVKAGDQVIIVDDVITSGAMIRETITILRDAGAIVDTVFGAVSRRDPEDWPELADLEPAVAVYPILRLSDTDIAELVAEH